MNTQAPPSPMLWRWFALDPAHLSAFERTVLRVSFLVGLLIVITTYFDIHRYAGVDLRNRVVGARVMLAGYDPYTFVWESGMPEEWLDPVHDKKAHRLTLSPPMLLPYAAIAPLPYRLQRFVSFVAEWLALIASLALLVRVLPEQRQRVIFLVGATVFVIATDVWRLHLERGQIYVYHLLALSCAIYFSSVGRVDSVAAGIALGVLGLMRPNLLVMAPALLLLRQWRAGRALGATVGVGLAATFMVAPTSSWRSYLDVGDQYYRAIQDAVSVPDRPRPSPGGWAEGVDFDQALPNVESVSFAVVHRALHEAFELPMIDLALASKVLMACVAFMMLALIYWRGADARHGFALAVVMAVATEFFLPHRWGYADVFLLAPIALALPMMPAHHGACVFVLLGLAFGSMWQHVLGLQCAAVLRSWLVMAGVTGALFADAYRSESAPES